jgi:hypothetical protein
MNIAVVYPGIALRGMDRIPAWSLADGLVRELRDHGHQVEDVHRWRPTSAPRLDVDLLNRQDLVIVSGPEYIFAGEQENGQQLLRLVKAPKFAVYWDTLLRPDKSHPFGIMVNWFDENFLPAVQDVQTLRPKARDRVHWLEYGVDTRIFLQRACRLCKGTGQQRSSVITPGEEILKCGPCRGTGVDDSQRDIAIAFVGNLTGRRAFFHQKLNDLWTIPASFQVGPVWVHDLDGVNFKATAERVALNLNRMLIFLNLPGESEYVPPDVYEAMACGCCVLTPQLRGAAQANLATVRDALAVYPDDPKTLDQILGGMLCDGARCRALGYKASVRTREKHTLTGMAGEILKHFSETKTESHETMEITV